MFHRERLFVAPDWESWLRAQALTSVDACLAFRAGVIVRQGSGSEVRRVELRADDQTRIVFLKKHWIARASQLRQRIFRGTLFGRSRVRREFFNLQQLRNWGLNAPTPVAFGEERRFGWLVRSFLITEGVPRPLGLDQFIRDHLPTLPPAEQRALRRELILNLSGVTRRMHERGFCHRDFFWRNLVLEEGRLNRICILDSPRGQERSEGMRARAFDLAALDAPAPAFFRRPERLRFFLAYAGHARLTESDKALLRLTLRLAEPDRKRQIRHVGVTQPRPLSSETKSPAR